MRVSRLDTYYAFWLPIAVVLIVLEVTWRRALLAALAEDGR